MARKKNNALTEIIKDAKRLRREYPKRYASWNEYVAQASAIYSSKHKGRSPVGRKHPPKKKSMPKKRKARKVGKSTGSGVSTNSRSHTDYNRNKVNITVGAVNKHKKAAKEKLEHLIGVEYVKQFKARLKRTKKKIAKRIRNYKAQVRRLAQ
jgi:hypothetical protein